MEKEKACQPEKFIFCTIAIIAVVIGSVFFSMSIMTAVIIGFAAAILDGIRLLVKESKK